MKRENKSSVSEFLLLGLPIWSEQQGTFFTLFLGMYLTTVLGNLLIILLIRLDPCLHTPKDFFLGHLAFSDVSFSSVSVPNTLRNMQTQHLSIPYVGCISQMYFFILFVCLDNFLLAVMAYDRYVAICQPLHYITVMREELCIFILLVAGSWLLSCADALLHTLLSHLSFCTDNTIPHFFCDLTTLLKLTCSDTSLNELVIFTEWGVVAFLPCCAILGSYIRIGATMLSVPSIKRICKALSTCGSYLLMVFLYCGTLEMIYFIPSSNNSKVKDIIVSVRYTVVTPMLNPFIYTLRNRDMKLALGILYSRKIIFAK
uniref:LOW QUALITY PROTEIN: olfactory receptor 1J4-like n=1 Tax=Odobenus rosmarus divergens TaxID=9708 RepID=UPI00063C819F|nr:PREDICTED: LOW QUALITY PROTEIN: olfactory receptor 1J4-like [Odobenus rosmarus divergens]